MKIKKLLLHKIMVICVSLFFLIGCDSGGSSSQSHDNYKQGVSELQITLLNNAPPQKIFPNTDFKIIAKLDNQAGYDIRDGRLLVIGNFDNYFEVLEDKKTFGGVVGGDILEGRSMSVPNGEKTFVQFDGFAKSLYLNAEEQQQVYFLKANYESDMQFSDTVCINPNLYAVYDSGCQVKDISSYGGQGAPLAVTKMEELLAPGASAQVEFRLHLKNSGQGEVKSVQLTSAQLGGEELKCTFKNDGTQILDKIDFSDSKQKETVLICKALVGGRASYETTLVLGFTYEYELKQQHKLTLVR